MMTFLKTASIALCAGALLAALPAHAECVRKGAVATAGDEASAKWYALETMVQSVSWGLWPGFVANGKVAGYTVRNERYKCKKDGWGVTCRGAASFCKKG